jgi:outer membrane biosynthesis protein TonB
MIRCALPALVLLTACSRAPAPDIAPDIAVQPEPVSNVRVAPAEQPVAPGDCGEALRRAAAKPDLAVDRLPSPVTMKPAPLQKPPRTALRRDGSADVKVDIVVDTLGKADLGTFAIISSSSPWLAANVKSVIGKWKFEPAQLAGCKIPRVYHFMASTPATRRAGK